MGLNEIVRSKGYKNFMSKLYGFGAALVIIGALFKIQHYPGAGEMLLVGMGIEAVIFIFSAFEPLHEEYDWSLVYPELAGIEGHGHTPITHVGKPIKTVQSNDVLTEKLNDLLENANINPAVFVKLSEGLSKLTETTANINSTVDVINVNNRYASELEKMTSNLASLNELYLAQLKLSNDQMQTTSKLQEDMSIILENMNGSIADSEKYKSEINNLSLKVASLNQVYGKMLSAMGTSNS